MPLTVSDSSTLIHLAGIAPLELLRRVMNVFLSRTPRLKWPPTCLVLLTAVLQIKADPLPRPPAPLGREITVAPPANYGGIDVKLTTDMMKALMKGTTAEQDSLAAEIAAHAENYAPPVFFVLAEVMFRNGHPVDALFWQGAGQLRTFYDIARCADSTVGDTAQALSYEYTEESLVPYIRMHPDAFDRATKKVLDWDKNTPYDYDCRWINLHGMGAFGVGPHELSKPEAEWPALREQARKRFLGGRNKATETIRSTVDPRTGVNLMPADWGPLIPLRSTDDLEGKYQANLKTGSLGFGFYSVFPTWPPSAATRRVEIYPTGTNRAIVVAFDGKGESGRGEISLIFSDDGAVVLRPGDDETDQRNRVVVFRSQAGDLIVRRDAQFGTAPVTRSWERGNRVAKIEAGEPPPEPPPDLTPEDAVRAADLDPKGISGIFRFKVERLGYQNGWMYLDSQNDYRDPKCLVVALRPSVQPQVKAMFPGEPEAVWVGHVLRVQGTARNVKILLYKNGEPTGEFYYQTQIELRTPVLQLLPIPPP